MAYYICHELWLYPKYTIHMLGFICCKVNKHCSALWGDMNYILWVFILSNGVQGGEFNEIWKIWVSSLGIGLARWFRSFVKWLCELCLWSTLWCGALEVGCIGRYSFQYGVAAFVLLLSLVFWHTPHRGFGLVACCRVCTAWVVGLPNGDHITHYG